MRIETSSLVLLTWLRNYYMKANNEKNHLFFSGHNNISANIDDNITQSEDSQVILSVIIDYKLSFNEHIDNLCKKNWLKA